MKHRNRLIMSVLVVASLLVGCNIFDVLAPSESAADFIADGREALQESDYDAAIEAFTQAMEQDPTDARARWGLAKAYLRRSGYTSISIMTELSSFQTSTGTNNMLPFMDDPVENVNALYTGLIQANIHLKAIHDGEAWSLELDGAAVALDYTGTLAVQGILLFRDTNVDNQINEDDVNLGAFFDASGNLTFDPDQWASMSASDAQAMLNSAVDVIGESSDVLAGIYADLTGDSVGTGIDMDNLDEVISDLITGLYSYGATNP